MSETAKVAIEVPMPQLGVSVDEGTIIEWRVAVGERVEADGPLCDVSTDKVDSEVGSPVAGVLEEILVEPGTTVPVGTPLARILTEEVAQNGAVPESAPPPAATARPGGDAPSASAPAEPAGAEDGAADGGRRRFSPLVKRMAAEHGIDPAALTGSGAGGRVRKADVEAAIAAGEPARPAAAPSGESETMSRMRQAIARNMSQSRATAAHCHTWIEVDMTAAEAARAELGTTALPIVAEATVRTLLAHPNLNAWIEGEQITRHPEVHLGIAVALPGEAGLIVPVIRGAQRLEASAIDARIRALARAAREGSLRPDDVGGGTFTITSQGKFGTLMSAPIINRPQVGILDLQTVAKRPVVVTAPDGTDTIGIRSMSILGLSWDHRAIDGAQAAEFLAALRDNLQHPAHG